jgi:hypothetical protein
MGAAVDLMARGLVFVRDGRGSLASLRGPKPVVAEAAAEIARRADLMRPALRPGQRAPSVIAIVDPAPATGCEVCGEPLPWPFSAGGCPLCHAARRKVLRETGRVS